MVRETQVLDAVVGPGHVQRADRAVALGVGVGRQAGGDALLVVAVGSTRVTAPLVPKQILAAGALPPADALRNYPLADSAT